MGDTLAVEDLQAALARFAEERDWNQFHTPKNLAMALAGETGDELVAEFQWLTPDDSANLDSEAQRRIEDEVADVLIHLLRLSDLLDIDLEGVVRRKIETNRAKYPVEIAKGTSEKATRLPK